MGIAGFSLSIARGAIDATTVGYTPAHQAKNISDRDE
jgi:hypothetical protein